MKKNLAIRSKTKNRNAPRPQSKLRGKSPPTARLCKSEMIQSLLARPGGASIPELSDATGWQAHSVRGYISGILKKKLGLVLVTSRDGAGRRYRLEGTPGEA